MREPILRVRTDRDRLLVRGAITKSAPSIVFELCVLLKLGRGSAQQFTILRSATETSFRAGRHNLIGRRPPADNRYTINQDLAATRLRWYRDKLSIEPPPNE